MMMTTSIWACVIVVVIAVASDILTRRIPNIVTLGGFVAGLGIHAATGFVENGFSGGMRGLGYSLLGAVACGLIPFLAWKNGEMGGGDVKLFAAIGALVGPGFGFDVEARTFAFSLLVLFPYRLLRQKAIGVALRNLGIGIRNLWKKKDAREPYLTGPKLPPVILGPAIGAAFVVTLFTQGIVR